MDAYFVALWIYAVVLARQIVALCRCLRDPIRCESEAVFWSFWVLVGMAVLTLWNVL